MAVIPGAVYVDVRDDISDPNAAIPLLILPQGDFEALMGWLGIGDDTTVVVYDDYCGAGYYGAMNLFVLYPLGYEDVSLCDGPWMKWGGRFLRNPGACLTRVAFLWTHFW